MRQALKTLTFGVRKGINAVNIFDAISKTSDSRVHTNLIFMKTRIIFGYLLIP